MGRRAVRGHQDRWATGRPASVPEQHYLTTQAARLKARLEASTEDPTQGPDLGSTDPAATGAQIGAREYG
jgi:hypothetical protein